MKNTLTWTKQFTIASLLFSCFIPLGTVSAQESFQTRVERPTKNTLPAKYYFFIADNEEFTAENSRIKESLFLTYKDYNFHQHQITSPTAFSLENDMHLLVFPSKKEMTETRKKLMRIPYSELSHLFKRQTLIGSPNLTTE